VAVALVVLEEPPADYSEAYPTSAIEALITAVWPGRSWSRVTGPSGSRMCSDGSEVGKGKSLLTQTDLYGSQQAFVITTDDFS
jgi:hypothetical protein